MVLKKRKTFPVCVRKVPIKQDHNGIRPSNGWAFSPVFGLSLNANIPSSVQIPE